MSDPIDPAEGVARERREKERRRADRRRNDRRKGAKSSKLPVPSTAPAAATAGAGPAAFTAQMIGQEGQKRGLRGGPPVLERARSAYLEAEWTGPGDRRRGAGRTAKTDV